MPNRVGRSKRNPFRTSQFACLLWVIFTVNGLYVFSKFKLNFLFFLYVRRYPQFKNSLRKKKDICVSCWSYCSNKLCKIKLYFIRICTLRHNIVTCKTGALNLIFIDYCSVTSPNKEICVKYQCVFVTYEIPSEPSIYGR